MAQTGSRSTGAQSTSAPAAQTQTTTPAAKATGDSTSAPAAQAPAPATPAAGSTGPAAAAIRDAARAAETERLTKERDELRELLGDAPTLEVLRAEVAALQHAAAKAGRTGTHRFTMSAGVAADLEIRGFAVDGTNGDAFVRDGDRVKVTSRSGATRTVDMPPPSGAGQAQPAEKS